MPVTGVRGRQILDDSVTRADINVTATGSALITRILQGSGLVVPATSTGADTGTGDVELTLGNSGVTAGTYGSSSLVPVITVDQYGRVTGVSTSSITAGSGTVTSVGLSLPAIFGVANSPVTTSGTLTATFINQNANLVFAGPISGLQTAPTFRALVAADIPNLDAAKITSGVFTVTNGGTGAATLTGVVIGNGTSAMTAVQGTASQLLRRNAGNTAYEFFTFSGVTGSGTSGVIPIWNGNSSLANSIINYSGSTLQINSGTETFLNLRGDGQGYTQANIVFQTGTNTLDSPQVRGLGSYYFNEGNDVIWYFGNAYGGANTDALSILRLPSATFNGAAADPAVGTRLFYIDINKSVFLNQIQSQLANNTATGGGQIYLNGGAGNRIDFNTAGVAAPSFTTRSVGTKILLYPNVSATNVDYALGIDSSTMWFSVPQNTGHFFRWYGGTTNIATLTSAGALTTSGPITSNQANGFTVGGLINVARIQYGSDAATSYSLLTAANGFAGLYASTGIFSSTITAAGGTMNGTLIFANATSPNTHTIQFGDNTGWTLRFMTNVSGTPTARFSFTDGGTLTATGRYISTAAWDATSGSGQIYLNGATGNRIDFNTNGVGAPAFTTRSTGTKIVLRPEISGSLVDYAIGVESDTLWYSTAAAGGNHKWYGATTTLMTLTGGNLVVGNMGASGKLTVKADTAGTSLYLTDTVNSTLIIQHPSAGVTRFLNGAAQNWLQESGGNIALGHTNNQSKLSLVGGSLPATQVLGFSEGLTTGRFGAYDANTLLTIASFLDSTTIEISSGSTSGWVSGISITGRNATINQSRIKLYTYSTSKLEVDGAGQLRLNNYTATSSFSGTAVGVLAFDSSGNIITIATPGGGSGITGTGTENYIPKFGAGGTSIGNSLIFDNGTNVGIGTNAPDAKLRVKGLSNGTQAIFGFNDTRGLEIATSLIAGTNEAGSILNARGATSGTLIFQTDGTERARISSNGLQITEANTGVDGLILTNWNSTNTVSIGSDTTTGGGKLTLRTNGSANNVFLSSYSDSYLLGGGLGVGTNSITNTANYTTLQVNGASGGIVRFSYAGTNAGTVYGSSAETGINAPSQINLYVANAQIANVQAGQFNTYETFYARKLGAQIQLAGGVGTASGLYQAGTNIVFLADWNTSGNGISIDVSNGFVRQRSSSASGGYIEFQRSAGSGVGTTYGFVGNSSQLFLAGFNGNTELGIRSVGAINFGIEDVARMRLETTGQLRLVNYTATNSFTGTLVGYLGFTSNGSIITTAAPSGSSQWTTSGTNIFYTGGRVGIGSTFSGANLPSAILDVRTPLANQPALFQDLNSGTTGSCPLDIVSNDTWQTVFKITNTTTRNYQLGTTGTGNTGLGSGHFGIYDGTATAYRFGINPSGQLRLPAYTTWTSFQATEAIGTLGFDVNGNIVSMFNPIYRTTWLDGRPLTLGAVPAAAQFFNNSNSYITQMDMRGKRRARLFGRVLTAATTGTVLRIRYRTAFSTTASDYLQMGASEIQISLTATGQINSDWIDLVAGAKAQIFLALQTSGGNGSTTPQLANIHFETEE